MKNGLILVLALLITGCSGLFGERGNGERITKTVDVANYNKIEIAGAFKVTLVPGVANKVTIETDENLFEYITIRVDGERLKIDAERMLVSNEGVLIEIPVGDLKALDCSGASDIVSKEPIVTENLDVDVSGAGKLDLQLDVESVKFSLSGATAVFLEGSAKRMDIEMSGAGSLEAEGLEVTDCFVEISGVGQVKVNVSGNLEAQVSGLGKVEYIGNPTSVKGDVSGIGKVDNVEK